MSEATQDPGPAPNDGESPRMAWTRLVLDFIAKAFYPAILLLVLLMLRPSLAQIDLPALINRLQSASVGGAELTFNQAEDVAITIAPLNGRIAEFERTVAQLRREIEALQSTTGAPTAAIEPSPEYLERMQQYERNSRYTVLVFHSSSSEARQRASAITQALLDAGYTASSTETDFSELRDSHPPGSLVITYSDAGTWIRDPVQQLIARLETGADIRTREQASQLRRGEMQILIF